MFGQFGHFFKYAKEKCDHPYPLERYANEVKRLLNVIDIHLEDKNFMVNEEYTIADIAIFPWVNCLIEFYQASDYLQLSHYKNVQKWLKTCNQRAAVKIGSKVCSDI
jgi:GST-like protein